MPTYELLDGCDDLVGMARHLKLGDPGVQTLLYFLVNQFDHAVGV